jgi:hypothetical protein
VKGKELKYCITKNDMADFALSVLNRSGIIVNENWKAEMTRLKLIISHSGLSKKAIADASGLQASNMSNYLNCVRQPSLSAYLKITKAVAELTKGAK